MRSSLSILAAVLLLAPVPSSGFVPPLRPRRIVPFAIHLNAAEGDDDNFRLWAADEDAVADKGAVARIAAGLNDMLSDFDGMVDDFFNKRMGYGETFYGKRKYKPSGRVSSDYSGGGLSDWRKIEAAREFREERARIREEARRREG